MDDRYRQRRVEIESLFRQATPDTSTRVTSLSPSGDYQLEVLEYVIRNEAWRYSRGKVVRLKDDAGIADIKRNYSQFWSTWVQHANGAEYLLCGEDYQGQTVVNLSTQATLSHFPEEGYNGAGFCWTGAYPSPSSQLLAVDGCYWACPYELVIFDFSDPDQLPYPEIARFPAPWEWKGWIDNESFEYMSAVDVRKSDGTPYDALPQAEQETLDRDWSQIETRRELRRFSVPRLPASASE